MKNEFSGNNGKERKSFVFMFTERNHNPLQHNECEMKEVTHCLEVDENLKVHIRCGWSSQLPISQSSPIFFQEKYFFVM